MDLKQMREKYIKEGYEFLDASAKVCQDIILSQICARKLMDKLLGFYPKLEGSSPSEHATCTSG